MLQDDRIPFIMIRMAFLIVSKFQQRSPIRMPGIPGDFFRFIPNKIDRNVCSCIGGKKEGGEFLST